MGVARRLGTLMIKLAIAVKSCHRDLDAGLHDAIRGTWGGLAKTLGIDVFFFVGKDPTQQDTRRSRRYTSGEVVLDCDDHYDSLPIKTRRICQWLEGKVYTNLFFCDNDTFVRPKLFDRIGFENYDYYGDFFANTPGMAPFKFRDERGFQHDECRAWASGGFGYFLSRKAAEGIAATPPRSWAEDMYVGQVLAPAIDAKYITARSVPFRGRIGALTEHWGKERTIPFTPKIIQLAWKHDGFRNLFVNKVPLQGVSDGQ